MKSILMQVQLAIARLEERPYLSNSMSHHEMGRYQEGERLLVVDVYTKRLEKYLQSEEGLAAIRLFNRVWELSKMGVMCRDTKDGWLHWRVFLYRGEPRDGPNEEEIIWFGGNGLELYYRENSSNKYKTKPVTARELVTRMSLNRSNWDQAEISRPEQVIPYIRLATMDLVRYLNR